MRGSKEDRPFGMVLDNRVDARQTIRVDGGERDARPIGVLVPVTTPPTSHTRPPSSTPVGGTPRGTRVTSPLLGVSPLV